MKKTLVTVGTFDGVHSGHRFLFTELEKLALRLNLKPLVLYFPLPPKTLLSPRPEMTILTSPDEKKRLFKQLALNAHALDFDACRNLSAQQFIERVLVKKYNAGGILAGPDFAFGKDRTGDLVFLQNYCAKHNLQFCTLPFYKVWQDKISSSLIRKMLSAGDIAPANELLSRPYELTGRVIKGHRLGRKLGFPTANLDTGIYKLLPLGVFAVRVRVGMKIYNGFCNIGFRPTVNPIDSHLPLVEVHIFDFKQSIYGRKITIWFHEKLRDEMKFTSLDALTAQLTRDREHARRVLG
jgi:riboflavin kinase/FMN adenylyltransferase